MENSRQYETREQAANGCKREGAAAESFCRLAIQRAKAGRKKAAWGFADTSATAAECARQAERALWKMAGGRLTPAEWKAFEAAENAQYQARKAAKAAANA